VDLNETEFDLLADYAVRHGVSMADAARYAISLMLEAERCASIADDALREVLGGK
jgi:hypothetical protein